jgi:hypothetical protein
MLERTNAIDERSAGHIGADEARGSRAPRTRAVDGLDHLTVPQARALHPSEFERLFEVRRLEDVPVVGPGYLPRAPKEALWYLRLRLPGGDRKRTAVERVTKRPKEQNPGRTALTASGDDQDGVDRARLEALVKVAREEGRGRRGSTMSRIEVENMPAAEVIEAYVDEFLQPPPPGEPETEAHKKSRTTYACAIKAFKKAFAGYRIGDFTGNVQATYAERRPDRWPITRGNDLNFGKMALNHGLEVLGIDWYRVKFKVRKAPRTDKPKWDPKEYDRLKDASLGFVHRADGGPVMVGDGKRGRVRMRRKARSVADRGAWSRAIPFQAETGGRSGLLAATTWTDPTGPWIAFVGKDVIFFRKGWLGPQDSPKRGDPVIVPEPLATEMRGWRKKDIAAGIDHPFHRADGTPYSRRLDRKTFQSIVEDAGISRKVTPHDLKSLCVEMADALGVSRHALSQHVSTTPETLEERYGPEADWAALKDVAQKLSDKSAWRKLNAELGALRAQIERARAGAPGIPRR